MGVVSTETSSIAAPAAPAATASESTSESPSEATSPADAGSLGSGVDSAAAGEGATEKPVEKPAEVDSAAKRFAAAVAAEKRGRSLEGKAREAISKAEAREAAIAKREAELAAREAEVEAALEDPIGWHIAKGKDPEEVAKRFLKPVTEEQKRLAKLEKDRADELKARAESEEKAKASQAERQSFAEAQRFVASITPDAYPYITTVFEPHEVPVERAKALREHGPAFRNEHGRDPSEQEIKAFLEEVAKAEFVKRDTKYSGLRQRLTSKQTTTPSNGSNEQALVDGSGPRATNGPSTLTNNHAAQASTGKTRPRTKEERKRALIEQLEAESRQAPGG